MGSEFYKIRIEIPHTFHFIRDLREIQNILGMQDLSILIS